MDDIIEIIVELLFEGSIEVGTNKKVSKYIRYPLLFIVALMLITIIGGLFVLGVILFRENSLISAFFIVISLVLGIGWYIKFKKIYLQEKRKKQNKNNN